MASERWEIEVCTGCGNQVHETYKQVHDNHGGEIVRVRVVPEQLLSASPTGRLISAALKLADAHDEAVDGEWGSGDGSTQTEESEAVRTAVAGLPQGGVSARRLNRDPGGLPLAVCTGF